MWSKNKTLLIMIIYGGKNMITCRVCGHLNDPSRLTCEECGSDLSDSVDWIGDEEEDENNNDDNEIYDDFNDVNGYCDDYDEYEDSYDDDYDDYDDYDE